MNLLETNSKNINNPTLFKQLDDFMMEVFGTIEIRWSNKEQREHFVSMIDQWLDQISLESGKFTQHDVVCDRRNNKTFNKNIKFVLRYTQKNCFNTSEIEYIFEK